MLTDNININNQSDNTGKQQGATNLSQIQWATYPALVQDVIPSPAIKQPLLVAREPQPPGLPSKVASVPHQALPPPLASVSPQGLPSPVVSVPPPGLPSPVVSVQHPGLSFPVTSMPRPSGSSPVASLQPPSLPLVASIQTPGLPTGKTNPNPPTVQRDDEFRLPPSHAALRRKLSLETDVRGIARAHRPTNPEPTLQSILALVHFFKPIYLPLPLLHMSNNFCTAQHIMRFLSLSLSLFLALLLSLTLSPSFFLSLSQDDGDL